MGPKKLLLFSLESAAAPPPSPIPTARGSRSASDDILSEYIDRSIRIPHLILPQHVPRFKPEIISYESLKSRENDSVRRLLKSARDFGVFHITDHGISTSELSLALLNSERVFGLMTESCTVYGDHEKLIWHHDGDEILEDASFVIGEHNFQVLREQMLIAASQFEAVAQELTNIFAQSATNNQNVKPIQLEENNMNIYRYHRANIIDRNSSGMEARDNQVSTYQYALSLSLHLLLEAGEFRLLLDRGNVSFDMSKDAIVVKVGNQLEEWGLSGLRSSQGKLSFKPFLHTRTPSFSIEQSWSILNFTTDLEESKLISLSHQIFFLLFALLLYRLVC